MLFEEVKLMLLPAATGKQLAGSSQTIGPVGERHPTGFLQIGAGVFACQVLQAHQHPHGFDAAGLSGSLGPCRVCGPMVATCHNRASVPRSTAETFSLGMCSAAVRNRPGSALA